MKKNNKAIKIASISLGAIFGLPIVAVLSLNLLKGFIYFDYYQIESRICGNPGLNDGAIPQGVATDINYDFVLTTAYMQNKSNSRIYMCENNRVRYVNLIRDGKKFTNHVGGIGLDKDNVYISNNYKIYTLSVNDLIYALDNKLELEVGSGIEINNKSSFCTAHNGYLYVGEYSDGKEGTTNTKITHDGKVYNAVITKYDTNDLSTPIEMYATRDKAQGVTVNDEGDIYISTSFGLSDSHYYKYSKDSLINPETFVDNLGKTTNIYYLDDHIKHIKGPAMAEDLSFKDGKVITLSESASNKYIFGKFFFAYDVVGLKF